MSLNRISCDSELLRLSLSDRLSEQQEESLTLHLAECVACQRELERLAGQQNDWDKVRQALRHELESSQGGEHDLQRLDRSAEREVAADEDAAVDFAVDFLEPSSAPGAIGRIGDIDILEVIGRGGMGVVLKGYQPELKRLVAVKVLAPHLAVSGSARQRFSREAQATAAIMHPNVVPILTVHSTGKLPFLVMPFLACESLHDRIVRQGALELVDILRIGLQTAQGLAAAHAQGIVHRDVKPANILLEKGVDRAMLTDFGLARAIDDASITRTGVIAGTPQYMSPEQARGDAVDARSDLFSLGSVLYTMATGRSPFRAESTYGILRRITDSRPRAIREINPGIPSWLISLIEKLLAKQPSQRFGSALDVAALFEQCLAHVQQPAAATLPDYCLPMRRKAWLKWLRRKRWTLGAMGLGAVSVALLLFVFRFLNPAVPLQSEVARPNESTVRSSPSAAAIPEWNATAQELRELDRDAAPFESRVGRLWDRSSAPVSPESNLPSTPSTDMESKP
ncbi:MAG: serine/threonine-protein kinase [Planctomycetota bacterium]